MKLQQFIEWLKALNEATKGGLYAIPTQIEAIFVLLENEDFVNKKEFYFESIYNHLYNLSTYSHLPSVNGFKPSEMFEHLKLDSAARTLLLKDIASVNGQEALRNFVTMRVMVREQDEARSKASREKYEREQKADSDAEMAQREKKLAAYGKGLNEQTIRMHIQKINIALAENKIQDLLFWIYSFASYITAKIGNKNRSPADIQEIMDATFKRIFAETTLNNPKLFLACYEVLLNQKFAKDADIESKTLNYQDCRVVELGFRCLLGCNGLPGDVNAYDSKKDKPYDDYCKSAEENIKDVEAILIKQLVFTCPAAEIIPRSKMLFPNPNNQSKFASGHHQERFNGFMQNLFKYELENVRAVNHAQANLNGDKNKANNAPTFAFEMIKHLHEVILTTQWPVNKVFAHKIYDQDGHFLNYVPENMLKMLKAIQIAYATDKAGTDAIWVNTLNDIGKIGVKAAKDKPFSIFGIGARGEKTQVFYDQFVKAITNIKNNSTKKNNSL